MADVEEEQTNEFAIVENEDEELNSCENAIDPEDVQPDTEMSDHEAGDEDEEEADEEEEDEEANDETNDHSEFTPTKQANRILRGRGSRSRGRGVAHSNERRTRGGRGRSKRGCKNKLSTKPANTWITQSNKKQKALVEDSPSKSLPKGKVENPERSVEREFQRKQSVHVSG